MGLLTALPASELARLVRAGEVSAVELLDAHLARIAEVNGDLNAVVSLDAELARDAATSADAALAADHRVGPLHGVPMTLKDGHDVAGLRTTVGTPELDRVADEDGAVAARLRAAGAVIVGHTNVAAGLAAHTHSGNPIFGRTKNPRDTSRSPGGSSGGAAAALAAGMTPLEVGSDMVGSIRLPAHFCGVYGLRTTERRIAATGFFVPRGVPRTVRVLNSFGPMARDLDDLELALRLLAGPDGEDGDVAPVPVEILHRRPPSRLRLAVVTSPPLLAVGPTVRGVVEGVAAGASDAGAAVVEALPDRDWSADNDLLGALLSMVLGPPDPARPLQQYLEAIDRRDRVAAAWDRWLGDFDALVLPVATTAAFPHDKADRHDDNGLLQLHASLAGLPALAVPAGASDDGLPIGVQLVGARWSEMRLLAVAHALEDAGVLPGFVPT